MQEMILVYSKIKKMIKTILIVRQKTTQTRRQTTSFQPRKAKKISRKRFSLYTYSMPATSLMKYSTALSSKAGLVDETFIILRLMADGKTEAELRFAFLQEDLLGKDSQENRLNFWKRLHQRYLADWNRAILLARLVDGTSNYDLARLFVYYDFCRVESILYDAVTQPVYMRFADGFNGVEIGDLQTWLDGIEAEHSEVKEWSPQTRKKVLSNVLAVLRDFGLMSGKVRKTFERVYVPVTLAGYVLYSLKDSLGQFGPRAVIESPDWRLFFLDEGDVVNLLKEMAHEGYCTFQKQGEVMTLDLQWQNLEGYIEAITGKV
jgi:hypothetical protein